MGKLFLMQGLNSPEIVGGFQPINVSLHALCIPGGDVITAMCVVANLRITLEIYNYLSHATVMIAWDEITEEVSGTCGTMRSPRSECRLSPPCEALQDPFNTLALTAWNACGPSSSIVCEKYTLNTDVELSGFTSRQFSIPSRGLNMEI